MSTLEEQLKLNRELYRYHSIIDSFDPHNIRLTSFHLPSQLKSLGDCYKTIRIETIEFAHGKETVDTFSGS